MSLDLALWLAGTIVEAAVVALILYRGIYRTLPFFSAWTIWALLSDVVGVVISRSFPSSYVRLYVILYSLDSLLQFGVLVELTWSVLRPFREALPRWSAWAIPAFVILIGAAIWPFASIPGFASLPSQWHFLVRVQQTFSILRVLMFLVLAGGSQLLAIGWRNRELQVATGLGFYSLVSLGAQVFHVHNSRADAYHLVDRLVVVSYLCSLLYWIVSFAQKEAERKEVSPKMKNVLMMVAGESKATRASLAESNADNSKLRRRR